MPDYKNFEPLLSNVNIVIDSGQTTSSEIDLRGNTICGLYMPATFTGTSINFSASKISGGSFQTVNKNGTDFSISVSANKYIVLNPADFTGVQFLKISSSATESAERTISLAIRPV